MTAETAKRVARAAILPWKGLLTLGVLVGAITLVESCAADSIKENTVTAEKATCSVRSFDEDSVAMNLHCNAQGNAKVADAKLAVAYLRKPGPLVCTLYEGTEADCELAGK